MTKGAATLREMAARKHAFEPAGTPEEVADTLAAVMAEVGGDGFLFYLPNMNRRAVAEITEGLVPVLQKRGLTRRRYSHHMFRDNLLEF